VIVDHVIRRYKRPEDARMALEQMEGFELAGRTVSRSSRSMIFFIYQRSMFSSASRLCMKRVPLVCSSRTVWMKLAVSKLRWLVFMDAYLMKFPR
jgi:hypothetical protein